MTLGRLDSIRGITIEETNDFFDLADTGDTAEATFDNGVTVTAKITADGTMEVSGKDASGAAISFELLSLVPEALGDSPARGSGVCLLSYTDENGVVRTIRYKCGTMVVVAADPSTG